MTEILSSWQRVKLKHKTGERKKQIEERFDIKSQVEKKKTIDLDEERARKQESRKSKKSTK